MITKEEFEKATQLIEDYKAQLHAEIRKLQDEIRNIDDHKNLIVSKNQSVRDLDLSVRALNVLNRNDINTIGELMVTNIDKLIKTRYCGKVTANEIKSMRDNLIIKDL